MKTQRRRVHKRSRGAILPLTAVALVGLCGFTALAVDLGMLAVAQGAAQDAADAAAVAGSAQLEWLDRQQPVRRDSRRHRTGQPQQHLGDGDPEQRSLRQKRHLSL